MLSKQIILASYAKMLWKTHKKRNENSLKLETKKCNGYQEAAPNYTVVQREHGRCILVPKK